MTHADIAAELSRVAGEIRSRMLEGFPDSGDFLVIVNMTASSRIEGDRCYMRATVYHDRMMLVDNSDSCGVDGTLDDIADKAVVAAHDKMHAATLRARQIAEGVTA